MYDVDREVETSEALNEKTTATHRALALLRDSGATLAKQEDRSGDTKSGWWLDGVYLGKDAKTAATSITGG